MEIGDVTELVPLDRRIRHERQRILKVAQEQEGGYHIVFIHADGDGDWQEAVKHHIEPASQTLIQNLTGIKLEQIVGVVPVREMEAWAMVEGEALRKVFGTSLDDNQLGTPSKAREVEKILDPKKALGLALKQALEVSGVVELGQFYTPIGEAVSLDRLRQVPSFQRFEADLRMALTALGYIN